ncbi:hypothetical protein GCM10010275_38680 [Streptomyces litmocidini]|nr:hypothetical protein GCM10010275_38680 [Streptomyces litmocidini]
MSLITGDFDESVVVRAAQAEVIGRAPSTVRLLADSSATGGALSAQRVTLTKGAALQLFKDCVVRIDGAEARLRY